MYVLIYKQYSENFTFLIQRILEFFIREVSKFSKKQGNFQHILLLLNVYKQTSHISHVRLSQKVKSVITWNLRHTIFM